MQWKNTLKGYGAGARLFHIIIAMMIIAQLGIGTWMVGLPKHLKSAIYGYHKTFGLVLLIFVFLRLSWRFVNVLPGLPNTPRWQVIAARSLHRGFYVMMIGLPISGWMMSTAAGLVPSFPGIGKIAFPFFRKDAFCILGQCYAKKGVGNFMHDAHEMLGWALAAALLVHVMIALWHFHLKDGIFERIFLDRTESSD